MQGVTHILDRSGHTDLVWDTESTNTDPENGPLDPAFVEQQFDKMVAAGYFAFGTTKGESELLKKFTTKHEEITLSPRFVGG